MAGAPRRSFAGGLATLSLDYARYNPPSLFLKQSAWLDAALAISADGGPKGAGLCGSLRGDRALG
jgi:hypothetical protein